jgi:internalin A
MPVALARSPRCIITAAMNWIDHAIAEARQTGMLRLDFSSREDQWHRRVQSPDKSTVSPQLVREIFSLRNLRSLALIHCNLPELPLEIGELTQLEELEVSESGFVSVPRTVERLTNLRRLTLDVGTQVVTFNLEALQQLEHLDLGRRTDLPPSVLELKQLTTLRIGSPAFFAIDLISGLTGLRELTVYDGIPTGLFRATRDLGLRHIELSGNTYLPPEDVSRFGYMQTLESISLPVSEFPTELAGLPCLQSMTLRLRDTKSGVPDQIAEFEHLRELAIYSDRYSRAINVSKQLLKLRHLTQLALPGANLENVYPRLPELSALTHLNLGDCGIQEWEPILDASRRLQSLDVAKNYLVGPPRKICEATELQSLLLDGNNIQTVPEETAAFAQLEVLSLANTRLSTFPLPVLRLRKLKDLNVSENPFGELPPEIVLLDRLENLKIAETGLRRLPSAIANLTRLHNLSLSSSAFEFPPPEIVAQGALGIQNYFSALAETPPERLYEAKLLIVGEGAVGKTWLATKLVEPHRDLDRQPPPSDSTEGIEIRPWDEPTRLTDRFRINVWDFGGQEIYHATHQFFLTKRSLYLFVWDARKEDRTGGFDYWLNVVKLLSAGSPTMIVLNKADERVREIDEVDLKNHFPNIQEFHKVSARTGMGMDTLRQRVVATVTSLPHVGDEWPRTWNNVRLTLESDSRDYITREEFEGICREQQIPDAQMSSLAAYLHDLGVVLHFQEDAVLRRIVILRTEWGTNAVYRVLDTRTVQDARGRFTVSDLSVIWGSAKYPVTRHPDLLHLMMKFELCFPLGQSGVYVAPELLAAEAPALDWDTRDNLVFQYHYLFMPAGIITRFIARMHAWIEGDKFWRNGVALKGRSNRAVVISEPLNRRIRIALAGPQRRELLAIVRYQIDDIHKTLNDPTVAEMVPCSCTECQTGNPHLFSYATLEAYFAKRIEDIRCEKSLQNVSIRTLLAEVVPPAVPEVAQASLRSAYSIGHVHNLIVQSEGTVTGTTPKPAAGSNPWISGSFYLFALVVILAVLMVAGNVLSPWWLPVTILGGLLLVTVVGALQLRNDDKLTDRRFIQLMRLAFHQIPLLGNLTRPPKVTSVDARTDSKT